MIYAHTLHSAQHLSTVEEQLRIVLLQRMPDPEHQNSGNQSPNLIHSFNQ